MLKHSVDELLCDDREKYTSFQMKDGHRFLQGDGNISSRRTRIISKIKSKGKTADAIEQGQRVISTFFQG